MGECGCGKLKEKLLKLLNKCNEKLIHSADDDERDTALIQLNFLREITPIIDGSIRCRCYDGENLLTIRDILERDRARISGGDLDPRNIQGRYAVVRNCILMRP